MGLFKVENPIVHHYMSLSRNGKLLGLRIDKELDRLRRNGDAARNVILSNVAQGIASCLVQDHLRDDLAGPAHRSSGLS
jgi:hypothetical protein